jgi:ferric-dicitrate binding protein FerR (iron transport regulator)
MTPLNAKLSPQIVEEASDWFVEFSEGNVDVAARERFDTWLRRSPEHVQAYLKITALWEDAPMLQKSRTLASKELVARVLAEGNIVALQVSGPDAPEPSPDAAPPTAASLASQQEDNVSARSARVPALEERRPVSSAAWRRLFVLSPEMRAGSSLRPLVIAAALLITIGASTWFYVQHGTYSTAIGEQRSIRLDDGSTIDLNSQSKVRVRFSEQRRAIELLEGQALFRVAKNKSRPFVVATDNTHVRAVGTEFDVYRKTSGTVVTVLEGRVAVLSDVKSIPKAEQSEGHPQREEEGEAPQIGKVEASRTGAVAKLLTIPHARSTTDAASTPETPPTALASQEGEIVLGAGEQLTVTSQAVSQPAPANVATVTAWTQRKIAFQGAPLSDVVDEFNRYNTRRLVISDQDLKSIKISGVFSSSDPDSLLRFLRELPNIKIHETDQEILILRK